MRCNSLIVTVFCLLFGSPSAAPVVAGELGQGSKISAHDFAFRSISGEELPLSRFKGKTVLVVNTASQCGYAGQFASLQKLYDRYKERGLVVLAVPSNDFGGQEPGSEAEIATFCQKNYGVTFPMMSKVHTKGSEQHPVYAWLTQRELNGKLDSEVKWNFQKYLINADGTLHTMLASGTSPLDPPVLNWIEGK